MTSAVAFKEERGQEEEAQLPAIEGEDMEAVRAYMLQLLTEGHGAQAIEMLLGLLSQLREEHASTLVRLEEALRQLYGRRSEKTPASQLQLLLSLFTQQQSAVPATADGVQAAAPAAVPADAPKKTPKRPPVRGAQALPAHLERSATSPSSGHSPSSSTAQWRVLIVRASRGPHAWEPYPPIPAQSDRVDRTALLTEGVPPAFLGSQSPG